jgi:hypothetical protein
MSPERSDANPPAQIPLAELERTFIDEYVRAQGYDPRKLSDLPDDTREALLKAASVFASTKLTQVESRSHYVKEIHEHSSGGSTSKAE